MHKISKENLINFVERNIKMHGSLFSRFNCLLCSIAFNRRGHLSAYKCNFCPLWDYVTMPELGCRTDAESGCSIIRYKGNPLWVHNKKLRGNKPALLALLRGLINHFS